MAAGNTRASIDVGTVALQDRDGFSGVSIGVKNHAAQLPAASTGCLWSWVPEMGTMQSIFSPNAYLSLRTRLHPHFCQI